MVIYFIIVLGIVAIISVAFGALLNKNKLLSLHTIIAIAFSSIIISIAMPFIFGRFLNISQSRQLAFGKNLILTVVISLVIYAVILLLSTGIISAFASGDKGKELEDTENNVTNKKFWNRKNNLLALIEEQAAQEEMEPEGAVLKAFEPDQTEKQNDMAQAGDENIFEKPVDSGQIIDKMGVETIDIIGDAVEDTANPNLNGLYLDDSFDKNGNNAINVDKLGIDEDFVLSPEQEIQHINLEKNADNISDDSTNESPTIEIFIDKAFELKTEGNYEEAILNYMYALEKGPDKDLVFWIVLDICVLYKNLGQSELAAEILEGYISNYGELMDESVKMEIERNLAYT